MVWLENGGKASKSLALGMVPRMHLVNLGTLHLAQTCHGKVAISCIFFGIAADVQVVLDVIGDLSRVVQIWTLNSLGNCLEAWRCLDFLQRFG